MRALLAALSLAWALAACGGDEGAAVRVRDAWVREPPGGQPLAAAYLLIENRSDEPQVLAGVDSPAAGRVEIHLMHFEEGRMRMRRLDRLQVPAGDHIALRPGGLHLMLMDVGRALRAGDTVELRLRFASGLVRKVKAPVRRGDYGE